MSLLSASVDPSRAIARLNRFSDLPKALEPAMRDAVLYVHSVVPPYPPPRSTPGRKPYVRTGTLGRSVTSMQGGAPGALSRVETIGGVVGLVGTNLHYAGYVIDEKQQAWMHKGRWWTLQNVVRGARGGIVKILQGAIDKLARE